MLKNKRILVTGGAGSIGSELIRQLIPDNEILNIDMRETEIFDLHEEFQQKGHKIKSLFGDVRNREVFSRAREFFGTPDIIFHTAALKHVTPSEWWSEEYVKTNIFGTLNVIQYAKRCGAKLINISTDKVVSPVSFMGATKLIAEMAVKNAGFISVRFGNVMSSHGSVLEIWKKQIERGEAITITDKRMTRYMMTIPEAVGLVVRASEIGQPGQIIILKMGEQISILELAEKILAEKRSEVGLKIIGRRPGEKLTEELMTEEEKKRAREIEYFWVIPPDWDGGEYDEKNESQESKERH